MATIRLLGGTLQWPATIPRPSEDAFWLAAAVPTLPSGTAVLDMGCGSGAVALALSLRQPTLVLSGLDNDAHALAAATHIAALNKMAFPTTLTDALTTQPEHLFPVVVCNPPFHARARGHQTPKPHKAQAHGLHDLAAWVKAWVHHVAPKGELYAVLHAHLAPELMACFAPWGGQLSLAPMATHAYRPPKRMLVRWQHTAVKPCQYVWYPPVLSYHSALRQAVLEQAAPLVVFSAA